MKDSHGQTDTWPTHCAHGNPLEIECERCKQADLNYRPPTIVQDYREYTADEILHGIVKFAEQAGWGDPANLGHWLGAAQRWAATTPVSGDLLESARRTIGLFAEEIYGLNARNKVLQKALEDADGTLCACRYPPESGPRVGDCNCDIHEAHRILRAAQRWAKERV